MGWLMVRGNFFIMAFGFLRKPFAPHLVLLSAQPKKWTAQLSAADWERSSLRMTISRVSLTDHWILGEYCLMRCMMGSTIRRRGHKVFAFKNFIYRAWFQIFSLRAVCRGLYFLCTNRWSAMLASIRAMLF
jgi:hypothetical protein